MKTLREPANGTVKRSSGKINSARRNGAFGGGAGALGGLWRTSLQEFLKKPGRKIALAGIREDDDDRLAFRRRTFGDLESRP